MRFVESSEKPYFIWRHYKVTLVGPKKLDGWKLAFRGRLSVIRDLCKWEVAGDVPPRSETSRSLRQFLMGIPVNPPAVAIDACSWQQLAVSPESPPGMVVTNAGLSVVELSRKKQHFLFFLEDCSRRAPTRFQHLGNVFFFIPGSIFHPVMRGQWFDFREINNFQLNKSDENPKSQRNRLTSVLLLFWT